MGYGIQLTIGIISAMVAIVAALISYNNVLEQKRIAKIMIVFSQISHAESLLPENLELLKLHNISEDLLKECDTNAKEVGYLILSFNAAQAKYLIEKKKDIILTNYRENMLNNEKVRLIWGKVLKKKMLQETPFVEAVDEYINCLKRVAIL